MKRMKQSPGRILWCSAGFESILPPTEPQILGWPQIRAKKPLLISAPTGSGKTLAAFLVCIDDLVSQAEQGILEEKTEVLYVSPLRALSNDVQKNLEQPLAQIRELADKQGLSLPTIKAAVRTGDTLAAERQSQIKHPPHILVTTPESLHILLTSERGRRMLSHVKTVIVDEIHALCDDKRGAHLSLSLERLDDLALSKPVRIGISATQKPLTEVAQYLVGGGSPLPHIVDVGHVRRLDLGVEVPGIPLAAVASHEYWGEMCDRIAQLVEAHKSTLVFVNTRRLSERVAHRLAERLGTEAVASHHGSLSRKIRLSVERRLKNGELKCLVATASLELGIDIGAVDLVCQIGSPRSIAVALQRIGRSGHWLGATPRGRFFPTTFDDLLEISATIKSIRAGELDRLVIPDQPLDILAQQIVSCCATREFEENELFALVRRSYPYRKLERSRFDEIVTMLSEGFTGRRGRFAAYLHRDDVNNKLRGRRNARLSAITSGGAIPETALYTVVAEPDGKTIGTIDEDFAVESSRGDIFLLGSTSWRVRRVENGAGRVLVEDAHGSPPTVPFWRGEGPGRTDELSEATSALRAEIAERIPPDCEQDEKLRASVVAWLAEQCSLSAPAGIQLIDYILSGRQTLGVVPSQKTIVAERFFDESGAMQLIIHSPFGMRVNKAWGLALRKRFCRSFNYELQASANDNGINISLLEQHSFPLADVFEFLHEATVEEVLVQAALPLPVFETRWRWSAGRSLAVLRFSGGRKVPPYLQRMRAQDLLASVFPQAAACQDNIEGDIELPDHPLVVEAMHDVLTEAMDLDGLKRVLAGINSGEITCAAVDTPCPSVFSHEIVNANPYAYLDDAPLEERRTRAVSMRRVLPDSMLAEAGRLDPDAIATVRQEAWPDLRDADELADFLATVVVLPEDFVWHGRGAAAWKPFLDQLCRDKRAVRNYRQTDEGREFVWQSHSLTVVNVDDAVAGWMTYLGPVRLADLSRLVGADQRQVEIAMLALESRGQVLRGQFTDRSQRDTEWCDRRLLARIHKLTLGELRKQIEPVTAAQFYRWLLNWQHLAPGTQVTGERGALEVLSQLAGFEAPASAWEGEILARRIKNYSSDFLDRLCMTGVVGWGRLSPHPAFIPGTNATGKRVVPSGAAPIAFFLRDEADWMTRQNKDEDADLNAILSHAARTVLAFLKQHGACFFSDIARSGELLKAEVESALWELVTAGLVTADGYDNLRSLVDPKRRAGQGRGRYSRPRHSSGRWSLLSVFEQPDRQRVVESACWMLLRRYGVVFRDMLAREDNIPSWRELLATFRQLEAKGELRGGRFVDGFLGEQFALPHAVESLRAYRQRDVVDLMVKVAAADPLNLAGILIPGEKIPAVQGHVLAVYGGVKAERL